MKRGKAGLIIVLIILVVAIAGLWYYYNNLPKETVNDATGAGIVRLGKLKAFVLEKDEPLELHWNYKTGKMFYDGDSSGASVSLPSKKNIRINAVYGSFGYTIRSSWVNTGNLKEGQTAEFPTGPGQVVISITDLKDRKDGLVEIAFA